MDPADHEQAGQPEVTVRCSQDPELIIQLRDRQFIDCDETVFAIEAHANGLQGHDPRRNHHNLRRRR